MTSAAETLLEQALTLPVGDRALLASDLLASLDSEALDEAEVERLWSAETERRATQLWSRGTKGGPWDPKRPRHQGATCKPAACEPADNRRSQVTTSASASAAASALAR